MAAINPLLLDTGTPPIPQAQGWAKAYDGAHGAFVDLSQAVPGYPPHPEMLQRLASAAGSPEAAQYGDIVGNRDLREVYASHVSHVYGSEISGREIAITAGCNQAFLVAMIALARAGDAVLLPAPWYFNHEMTLDMLGIEARPLVCGAEAGFVPRVEDAAALVDDRVRAIVLVTPNNPTGAIYPPETIAAFHELCRERGLWLVLDETYRDFLASKSQRPHDVFAGEEWRERVIQLYSFSKSYCIPGHRLGAVVVAESFVGEFAKVLDCVQICPPRVGQAALAWAVPALEDWRAANRAEIAARAAAFSGVTAGLNGWRADAVGAYFAYLRHPFDGVAAEEVAHRLAAERGVLCLPGPYFGPRQERHLRVAFANAGIADIEALGARLRDFAI